MLKTLGVLLFVVLLIVVVVILAVVGGLAKMFSAGRRNAGKRGYREADPEHYSSTDTVNKQFSKDEGEYVDFEEVKDNKDN